MNFVKDVQEKQLSFTNKFIYFYKATDNIMYYLTPKGTLISRVV